MAKNTMVFWSVKRLAKEYGLSPAKLGQILRGIGAKRWSSNSGNHIWYWEAEQ